MSAVRNRRVLIVEDNALIGSFIADVIEEAGGSVVGPVQTRQAALDALEGAEGTVDAAVVDLWLDGSSHAVADRLRDAGVPFIFATGHAGQIPGAHAARPVCEKPFTPHSLLAALRAAFEGKGEDTEAPPLRPEDDLG